LKAERAVDAAVLEGAKSQFDVIVDGVTVFSKRDTGRFPEPGEVARLLG
jgi:predicted Rdx family selenoprotein